MTQVAELVAQLKLQSEAFERKLDGIQKQVRGARSDFSDMQKAVVSWAGSFLSVGAAVRVVGAAAQAIQEAEAASAKLDAVLKATGHTAGLTSDSIRALANEIERTTLFDDKEIENASAVLATFRTVSGETFRETIKLATDMSAVFGQDLQSSVTMLGKALEDPTTGLTALKRVGVSFNETQKETIEKLVEANKLFEAQQEILKGVGVQVKGAAEAMKSGFTGALDTMKDSWGDFVDTFLVSGNDFANLQKIANAMNEVSEAAQLSIIKSRGPQGLREHQMLLADIEKQVERMKRHLAGEESWIPHLEDTPEDLRRLEAELRRVAGVTAALTMQEFARQEIAKDSARTLADQTAAEERLAKAREKAKDALELHEKLAIMSQERDQEAAAEEVMRLNAEAAERAAQAQEELAEAYRKTEAAMRPAVEQFEGTGVVLAELEAEAARAADAWASIHEGFESGFEAALSRQIRNFRDFAENVLTIWQRSLARVAASVGADLITRGLQVAVGALLPGGGSSRMVDSIPSTPGVNLASGGSGMTFVFAPSVSAIDARGVQEFFNQSGPQVAGAMVEQMKANRELARFFATAGM